MVGRQRWGHLADLGARTALYAGILLLPLVYWEGTPASFTVPKIGLLWFLAAWGTACWVLRTLLWKEGSRVQRLPLALPVLGLVVSFALAGIFSINTHLSLFGTYYRQEGLFTFIAYLAFFPLAATTLRNRFQVRNVLVAFLLASFLAGLIGLFQVLGLGIGPAMPVDQRLSSTFGNSNFAGQFFAMAGVVSLGLLLLYHRVWMKLLCLASFGLNLFALLETYTRGAWVALALGLIVLFAAGAWGLIARNRVWLGVIVLLILAALLLTYLLPGTERYALIPRLGTLFSVDAFSSRAPYWQEGVNVAIHYPLLGSGPETFRLAFRPFKSPAYLIGESEETTPRYSNLDRAHNEFIDVATARGLIGLVVFMVFLVVFFRIWRRLRGKTLDRFTRGLLATLLATWVTYLGANLFNFGMAATTPLFWVLTGCVASFSFFNVPQKGEIVLPRTPGRISPLVVAVVAVLLLASASFVTWRSVLLVASDLDYGRSLQARAVGNSREAVDWSRRAIAGNPEEGIYRLATGISIMDLALSQTSTDDKVKWLEEARVPLTEAIPMIDQPDTALINLGICDWQEAACYGPLSAGALSSGSRAMLEKARASFRACLDFDRTLPQAWHMLAQVDLLLGNSEEALEAARRALEINPNWGDAYLTLAKVEISLGDQAEARKHLQQLLQLDEGNTEGRQLLETLR
jgi:O-antigen ligase